MAKKGEFITRPDINKDWLEKNWINTTKSLRQLAIEQNVTQCFMERRAKSCGLTKSKFKYSLNKEKLLNYKDPIISYIAGLIATDGYLPKKTKQSRNSVKWKRFLRFIEIYK